MYIVLVIWCFGSLGLGEGADSRMGFLLSVVIARRWVFSSTVGVTLCLGFVARFYACRSVVGRPVERVGNGAWCIVGFAEAVPWKWGECTSCDCDSLKVCFFGHGLFICSLPMWVSAPQTGRSA